MLYCLLLTIAGPACLKALGSILSWAGSNSLGVSFTDLDVGDAPWEYFLCQLALGLNIFSLFHSLTQDAPS